MNPAAQKDWWSGVTYHDPRELSCWLIPNGHIEDEAGSVAGEGAPRP
jgi:hypothetical protein